MWNWKGLFQDFHPDLIVLQWWIQTFRKGEAGGGGHPDPEIGWGGGSPKKCFSAPRASVWSKNKGGAGPPDPSPGSATVLYSSWATCDLII